MYKRIELERKGYDVNLRAAASNWICELFAEGHGRSFFGATRGQAIDYAYEYVTDLEFRYQRQQSRLQCEGCGD